MVLVWPSGHLRRAAGQAGSAVPGVGRRVPLRHLRHPSTCNCYCGNELSHPSLFSSFGLAIQTFKRTVIKGGKILMHERAVRGDVRTWRCEHWSSCGGDWRAWLRERWIYTFFCLSFAISHWLRSRGKWVCRTFSHGSSPCLCVAVRAWLLPFLFQVFFYGCCWMRHLILIKWNLVMDVK